LSECDGAGYVKKKKLNTLLFLGQSGLFTSGKRKGKFRKNYPGHDERLRSHLAFQFRSRYQFMAFSMSLDQPELSAPCAMGVVITIRWKLQPAYAVSSLNKVSHEHFLIMILPARIRALKTSGCSVEATKTLHPDG
jgi:hypothetical protein